MNTCGTCKHYEQGECWFMPPVPVMTSAKSFSDDYGPRHEPARVKNLRPSVEKDDKCGQWAFRRELA